MPGPQSKDDRAVHVGAYIRHWRAKNNVMTKQLAMWAGVAHSTLTDIEKGHKAPSDPTIEKLALVLKKTVPQLLEDAENTIVRQEFVDDTLRLLLPPDNLRTVQTKRCVTCRYTDQDVSFYWCTRPYGPKWGIDSLDYYKTVCNLWAPK